MMIIRKLNESIEKPVKNGMFQFGTYNKFFNKVNLTEAEKPLGKFNPFFFKRVQIKGMAGFSDW